MEKMLKVGDYVYKKYYPDTRGKLVMIVDYKGFVKKKNGERYETRIQELRKVSRLSMNTFARYKDSIDEDKNEKENKENRRTGKLLVS